MYLKTNPTETNGSSSQKNLSFHIQNVWTPSKSGQYMAKEGYNFLVNQFEQNDLGIHHKLFWSSRLIPKAEVFAWLATRNKILTAERFNKMGFEGPSRCVMCKTQEESVDHLLLNCPFSARIWWWLCAKLGWLTAPPNGIVSLFQGWPIRLKDGILNPLWEISPSSLIWELWKEQNRRIFYNKVRKVESVINSIKSSIVENINCKLAFNSNSNREFT